MRDGDGRARTWAIAAAGLLALCCGFKLLILTGAVAALAGVGVRSWLLVGAGMAVAALAVAHWRLDTRPGATRSGDDARCR